MGKYKDLDSMEFNIDSPFEQYETKIMRLNNLLEITKIINSTLEEDNLAQTILYSCQGQFLIQNASLIILDDIDQLTYSDKISIGLDKEKFDIKLDRNSGLVKYFSREKKKSRDPQDKSINKKSFCFEEIKDKIRRIKERNQILELSPEVVSPLWGKNALYGFLILGKKLDETSFKNEDLGYIYQFSELAAISIENAKLFQMAILDRMTGLYNHQYFKNRLFEEIERTHRYQHPLSLMFLDIDHFKSFNDTYGHQLGDLVIKEVANIIKESFRKSDIPARYGGEEFAVILPETTIDHAYVVGEKVRQRIEGTSFSSEKGGLSVAISGGIAEYPLKKGSEKEKITSTVFVEMADQALYYSKKNGRNQLNFYSHKVKDILEKKSSGDEKEKNKKKTGKKENLQKKKKKN